MSKTASKRSANWLPEEDEQLAKSWAKVSEHPLRLHGLKRTEFWARTAADFNRFTPGPPRETKSLIHRWAHLQKATLSFTAIHLSVQASPPPGSCQLDWLRSAKQLYHNQAGKTFVYERAWMVLRTVPKWLHMASRKSTGSPAPPAASASSSAAPRPAIPVTPTGQLATPFAPGSSIPVRPELAQDQPDPPDQLVLANTSPHSLGPASPATSAEPANSCGPDASAELLPQLADRDTPPLAGRSAKRKFGMEIGWADTIDKRLEELECSVRENGRRILELQRTHALTERLAEADLRNQELAVMERDTAQCPDELARAYLVRQKKHILMGLEARMKADEDAALDPAIVQQSHCPTRTRTDRLSEPATVHGRLHSLYELENQHRAQVASEEEVPIDSSLLQ